MLSARMGRRGFFARSAVVGTALAANPVTYALTPTDAYAAICSCQGQGCECGVAVLRRLHRVLLHPHRPQPVPAGTRCSPDGGRSTAPASARVPATTWTATHPATAAAAAATGCAAARARAPAAAAPTATATTARPAAPTSATASATRGSPASARSCAGSSPASPLGRSTAPAPEPCASTTSPPPTTAPACTTSRATSTLPIEVAGGIRVTGWAIDADTNGPIDVHVYVDGNFARLATASGFRGDVPSASFPGMGSATASTSRCLRRPGFVRSASTASTSVRSATATRSSDVAPCASATRSATSKGAHAARARSRSPVGPSIPTPRDPSTSTSTSTATAEGVDSPTVPGPTSRQVFPATDPTTVSRSPCPSAAVPTASASTPSTPAPVATTIHCWAAWRSTSGSPLGNLDGIASRAGRLRRRGVGGRSRRHRRSPHRRPPGRRTARGHHRRRRPRPDVDAALRRRSESRLPCHRARVTRSTGRDGHGAQHRPRAPTRSSPSARSTSSPATRSATSSRPPQVRDVSGSPDGCSTPTSSTPSTSTSTSGAVGAVRAWPTSCAPTWPRSSPATARSGDSTSSCRQPRDCRPSRSTPSTRAPVPTTRSSARAASSSAATPSGTSNRSPGRSAHSGSRDG